MVDSRACRCTTNPETNVTFDVREKKRMKETVRETVREREREREQICQILLFVFMFLDFFLFILAAYDFLGRTYPLPTFVCLFNSLSQKIVEIERISRVSMENENPGIIDARRYRKRSKFKKVLKNGG